MSGFAAYYNIKSKSEIYKDPGFVADMGMAIRHRGQASTGEYMDENIAVFCGKDSISSPGNSDNSAISEVGDVLCTFDGRLYNSDEQKRALEAKGQVFGSLSQGELAIHLYKAHGTGFVSRLRGMFSFILYDKVTGTLMAARDMFGQKPLYYKETKDGVVLCSEMKGFFFDPGYKGFDVNRDLLQHYMTFQYVSEPDTVTGDIKIVPKGSYLLFSPKGQKDIVDYFKPVFTKNTSTTYSQRKAKLREVVESSIATHMESGHPLGTFLSSGVDSAIITAIASGIKPGLKAFTVGFDVKGYSELEHAREIASGLNIEHIVRECTLREFVDAYEKTIYHLDSPMADPSVVAINLICEEVAKHVKVVLSGEGSDEMFGGYKQYRAGLTSSRIYNLPGFIKGALSGLAGLLPDGVKGKGLITRGVTPLSERYVGSAFVFDEAQKKGVLKTYDSKVHFTQRTKDIYAAAGEYSYIQTMQHVDFSTWLPSDILIKGDRLSVANSIEVRMPYLDREVFEVARGLTDKDKIANKTTKYILRDTFSDLLNKETAVRPKLGYPVPLRIWLKDELYDWATDIIKNNTAGEYIDSTGALKLLEDHRAGTADYYYHLWTILTFLTWHRLYVADAANTKKRIQAGEL